MPESDLVFEDASKLYQDWLVEMGYEGRNEQIDMLRFITDVLCRDSQRIGLFEAGTGTGKTVAYCIAAALVARLVKKKLILVTSTVLLQRQLLEGELSELSQLMPKPLTFGILKGRGRYACIERLNQHANSIGHEKQDMFGMETPGEEDRRIAAVLLNQFEDHRWSGDMDEAPVPLSSQQHSAYTTDSLGCNKASCEFASPCPYFKVRGKLVDLDVIVTNYSLLMASGREGIDLLPDPSECIYVFDEVHTLPEFVMNSQSNVTGTKAILDFLQKSDKTLDTLVSNAGEGHPFTQSHQVAIGAIPAAATMTHELAKHLTEISKTNLVEVSQDGSTYLYRGGVVDDGTRDQSQTLSMVMTNLITAFLDTKSILDKGVTERATWLNAIDVSAARERLSDLIRTGTGILDLLRGWSQNQSVEAARWLSVDDTDWRLHYVPIAVDVVLKNMVWEKAHGVICTSATIYASGGLEHFSSTVGLNLPEESCLRLPSPFDVRSKVNFQVADVPFDRPGGYQFNEFVGKELPRILKNDNSGLILFNSRADMQDTVQRLPGKFRKLCLIQGNQSMKQTLEEHTKAIDDGRKSYLIGLASFREGIDLPGDYCRHVVIMRIPFAVPDDPVLVTRKERLQLDKPFYQFDVPEASLRLFQACGRLLRNEQDYGTITMFDRRIINARYRRQLLEPLPDYEIVDLGSPNSEQG